MLKSDGARYVALVGTVPFSTTSEVFRSVGEVLGPCLRRIPDGETGERNYWITSQAHNFHSHPAFEHDVTSWDPTSGTEPTSAPRYRLRSGVELQSLTVPSLHYPDFAKASFVEFMRAKEAGYISADTRFQISLPTPLAIFSSIIVSEHSERVAPAIEAEIVSEAREILSALPHDQLAIQWDVCVEVFVWEGIRSTFFRNPKEACIARLAFLGNLIPEPVELGFHFCYGDFRHKHGVEPKDMGVMVEMANAITLRLNRPISWVHMPVPRDRRDDNYFKPVANLKLAPSTEVYLGLVHLTDGEEGTRKRMSVADRFAPPGYGIATECGWGRRDPNSIPALMDVHRRCAEF